MRKKARAASQLYSSDEKLSPVLEVSVYDDKITPHRLNDFQNSVIIVGRADPQNGYYSDIDIQSDRVPKGEYFRITKRSDGHELEYQHKQDNNPLLYNGKPFHGKKSLEHGDVFSIGEYTTTLTYRTKDTVSCNELPDPVDPISLKRDKVILGRSPGNKNRVCLNHSSVSSPEHASIEKVGDAHYIDDLNNSLNGIYIDDNRLQTRTKLNVGNRVRIGRFTFVYTGTQLIQLDEGDDINIIAYGLRRETDGKLEDISLAIPPRKFVAIVGGSGAGKSTLLKALNGEQPAHHGSVWYNKYDYYKSLAHFNAQIGYVPQKDILHENLTVRDALYYSARLRFPCYYTQEMIFLRITEVLAQLHLTKAQLEKDGKPKYIKDLSGGQRKRVSIALELLTRPKILFLDEPTSGLDPGLDQQIMRQLRELVNKEGCTIVIVTHTTKSLHLCDYVCFLAEGGRLAYFGPPRDALAFFEKQMYKPKLGDRNKKRLRYVDIADVYEHLDTARNDDAAIRAERIFRNSREYSRYWNFLDTRSKSISKQITGSGEQLKRNNCHNQWKQFIYLCARYIKLLLAKADIRLPFTSKAFSLPILPILLLSQAIIVGALLLCFIGFGKLTDGFNPDTLMQCNIPSQTAKALRIPDTSSADKPYVVTNCNQLEHILKSQGNIYAVNHGGVLHIVEQSIQPGGKYSPIVLFIMAFASIMFGCVNAIREIVKEVDIYKRERDVGIGILPYLCSKVVVLGVLCLVQSAILVVMVSFLDPFSRGILLPDLLSGWTEIFVILVLTSWSGLMIGLAISAIAKNNEVAMSILPLLLLPQVILSGAIFPLSTSILQGMGLFVPLRWSMAALGSSVGLFNSNDQLFGNIPTYQGTLYSLHSQLDATRYLCSVGAGLFLMVVLYFFLTYGILLWKKRRPPTETLFTLPQLQLQRQSLCPECEQLSRFEANACFRDGTELL